MTLNFSKASKLYMDGLKETDGKNMVEKERQFRLHLNPFMGSMPLARISTFTLEKFRKLCREKGLSESSINLTLATYRHMSNKLFEWEIIASPLPTIKLIQQDNRRDTILSAEDKDGILNAALADGNSLIWLFIMAGLHTSLRHKEILSARFEHLNPETRRLKVKVKGGEWRQQPLTQTIIKILLHEREMAEDQDGWIFPNPASASGHYESMKSPFKRVVKVAGLDPKKVTPHTMRHTAITELAETNVDGRTIQAFSGHKSREMVWRYTHARDQRVNDALDQLENLGTELEQSKGRNRERS